MYSPIFRNISTFPKFLPKINHRIPIFSHLFRHFRVFLALPIETLNSKILIKLSNQHFWYKISLLNEFFLQKNRENYDIQFKLQFQ